MSASGQQQTSAAWTAITAAWKLNSFAMTRAGLLYLPLTVSCLLGCATQINATDPDTISIQIGVTESNPAGKSLGLAQERCAKRGKNAVLSGVRDQVIFEYVCR